MHPGRSCSRNGVRAQGRPSSLAIDKYPRRTKPCKTISRWVGPRHDTSSLPTAPYRPPQSTVLTGPAEMRGTVESLRCSRIHEPSLPGCHPADGQSHRPNLGWVRPGGPGPAFQPLEGPVRRGSGIRCARRVELATDGAAGRSNVFWKPARARPRRAFGAAHEVEPDELAAEVFRHEKRDAT